MLRNNTTKISLIVGFIFLCVVFEPEAFGASKTATLDAPFDLMVGETSNLNSELNLTLLEVIEDSRCPSNVTCVWEGTVSITVNLKKDGRDLGNHIISLGIRDTETQTFEGYSVRLINVQPYPLSTIPINPSEYFGTFLTSLVKVTPVESPLKQFNSGVSIKDIRCRDNLVLVIKFEDSSPACVKPKTSDKLFVRGWGEIFKNPIFIQPIIKTGTHAGHCIGYCSKEITITPEKIIFSQSGREFISEAWVDLPEKIKETTLSQKEWNGLIELVDFEKFNSLPDRFGCPGCADAPIVWIEIAFGDKIKKIEFEHGDKIPEIEQLIIALQKIQDNFEILIDSFEECIAAGNPVMESYPRQCRTNDGKSFIEELKPRIMSPGSLCLKYDGQWLEEFNECELISEEQCLTMKGTFFECESACRHNPYAEVCTMQCIPLCVIPLE